MNFELWLKELADFLVASGVPAEHGPMAALGWFTLCLTLLVSAGCRAAVEKEPALESHLSAEAAAGPGRRGGR